MQQANILNYQSFYLVGIKGVAMTSLAQCLVEAGKEVHGSDVAEKFVTQPHLDRLNIAIDIGFENSIPENVECLIYTSAHQSINNSQVQQAQKRQLPTYSQAEAIASLANVKKCLAVCGVGGKSTTSAMISWILEKSNQNPSFSVGVGDIPGLDRTGSWQATGEHFVIEADEYVTDPQAARAGQLTPRFSFLQPETIICTNLKFDHPDVYHDLDHTKEVFSSFFEKLGKGKRLIINGDDQELVTLAEKVSSQQQLELITYGTKAHNQYQLVNITHQAGTTSTQVQNQANSFQLQLSIPGTYNLMNAVAAVIATQPTVTANTAAKTLLDFRSTKRRVEFIGEKKGVRYYDDYAHHPSELTAVIGAFEQWYPEQRLVFAFQPHTYSRTKQLFNDFVLALKNAREAIVTDIFASARETADSSVSSKILVEAIGDTATYLPNNQALVEFCISSLQPGDVLVTLGAGDIYEAHTSIEK